MKQKQESFGFLSMVGTVLIGALAYVVVKKLKETDNEEVQYRAKVRPAITAVANKRVEITSEVVQKAPRKAKKVGTSKRNIVKTKATKSNTKSVLTSSGASLRQKKLYEYIKKNNSLVMSEALKTFKDINERTMRRDLVAMVKAGLIKKYGSTKSTKYVLK